MDKKSANCFKTKMVLKYHQMENLFFHRLYFKRAVKNVCVKLAFKLHFKNLQVSSFLCCNFFHGNSSNTFYAHS